MYQYQPYSLWALRRLVEYETMGERAQFMRNVAMASWAVAVDKRYNDATFKPYTEELFEKTYKSPFKAISHEETGEDIIRHLTGGGENE